MNIQFKLRYWSIIRVSRAFKHWKVNPENKPPLKYHMDKQKLILGKQFKKKRWRDHLEKYRAQKIEDKGVAATLFVLSNGCQGMGRSVLLQTNTERYLFNCGEGSQKYIYDVVNNIDTVDNIFFTHNCWDNVGGLIGLFLTNTHHTNRRKKTILHGPPHVADTLHIINEFSSSFRHVTPQYEWRGFKDKSYEDDMAVVDYVQLQRDKSSDTEYSDVSSTRTSNNIDVKHSRFVDSNKTVMAYIIQVKAMQLNNQLIKNLDDLELGEVNKKSGNVVELCSKNEVQSYRDKDLDRELGPIIILDVPSFDYMESLLTSEEFINFKTNYKHQPHMIVHMAPLEVVEDQRYKDFMTRFDDGTVHLMLNEKNVGPVVHRSQEIGHVYHKFHPEIFPPLHGLHHLTSRHQVQSGNIIQAVYSLQYTFRTQGRSDFQWEEVLNLNLGSGLEQAKYEAGKEAWMIAKKSKDEDEIEKWSKFDESKIDDELANLKDTLAEIDTAEDLSEEYPELTFLGTGSSVPSYRRNCSCILVQMRKDEYIMLDCGEGSLIQMYQMFGEDKTHHILLNLKAVFLSHLHYDHHGGVFGILEARNKLMRKTGDVTSLMILAHPVIRKWFHLYSNRVLGQEAAIRLFHTNKLFESIKLGDKGDENMHLVRNELNLVELAPVPVNHTPLSHGLVMKHVDGWKLTYSGDCSPTPALIRYGQDSDILIHEGTLPDIFSNIAKEKHHCTISQAIDVAEEMRAKFTILTHFSQRMRIPHFTDRFTENIGVAFDFMQVRPSQLQLLPLFKPVLEAMYGANIAYGYIRLTNFSAKFTDEYDSVIKQTALNDYLKQQENRKQKQEHARKLWLKNSTQLKRNLVSSEQSKTGNCVETREELDGSDTTGSNENICDTNNTNSNFQITHNSNKLLINDVLLKKLKKR